MALSEQKRLISKTLFHQKYVLKGLWNSYTTTYTYFDNREMVDLNRVANVYLNNQRRWTKAQQRHKMWWMIKNVTQSRPADSTSPLPFFLKKFLVNYLLSDTHFFNPQHIVINLWSCYSVTCKQVLVSPVKDEKG